MTDEEIEEGDYLGPLRTSMALIAEEQFQMTVEECESTVVLVEGDKETIVGSAFISLSDGELEVTMVIDHDIFMGRDFEIKFEETHDPIKGRQFKFVAKKGESFCYYDGLKILHSGAICSYCGEG